MIRLIDVFDVVDKFDCVVELYKDKMIIAMAPLVSSRTTLKICTSSIIEMI